MTPLQKASVLTLVCVLTFVVGWELYCRSQHLGLSFNDDESLWAHTRKEIYQSSPSRPVIIGSSRVKFDLDLDTWESVTGEKPVQLALAGTAPRPLLTDLANDENFKGTLIIGVTEGLFFTPDGSFPEREATKRVNFYPKWSLSQQLSFHINRVLEPWLYFLDEERLALRPLLTDLPIPPRPGTWGGPKFPREFSVTKFDRQEIMTDAMVADTAIQNKVKAVWMDIGAHSPKQSLPPFLLTAILNSVKKSVDQIRARGGKVVFVRMPSDGVFREIEKKSHPREQYWDRLLAHTNTPGIYFEDYPALSKYRCPEWSHLAPKDAVTFTQDFIPILQQKTGWPIRIRAAKTPLATASRSVHN
ncbi:hypothetical protein GCM10028803_14990 [Larkinella knui]|uniref:Uncharacterized protein n=1 Tax=Larkinella knui TaxID=2025310 RepID=A0A3P1C970_9BACT|nr:hypothetical protein [Larkinella knui]RRB09871.1 hypothetical protein EHT87_30595 [Larkinella knui]